MVLDSYRQVADRLLRPIAVRIQAVSPNLLSWISLLTAALTGIFLVLSFYIDSVLALSAALVSLLVSALFDALDGKVARLRGIESRRGDLLDHVFDRYADVFILTGLFFSMYSREWIALFGLLGVLLTSYMGTQAQAIGVGRIYGGVLGRADRLVILLLVIALHIAFDPGGSLSFGYGDLSFTMMEYALLLFGILGNLTAIQRFVAAWKQL
ncbi:MAG: CDP-alcohol phosphatidyltransferase family protein [Candidatus Thermoplasmatota archaeon]|nr:CDP-alcohol phosphatidyltransferase family protein [Candidatus Thermoplasmatota archaeon]